MYPVTLEVRNRKCLVVGGGGVALRKVQGLVEEGAKVTVVALEVVDPLAEMAEKGAISLELRAYDADVGSRGRVLHLNGLFRHGYLMAPALALQAAEYLAQGIKGDLLHED